MQKLVASLKIQMEKLILLDEEIKINLAKIGYEL
jgi:hypothetical protein